MKFSTLLLFISTFILASCVQDTPSRNASIVDTPKTARILAMGDSMMAAHRISGRAISDNVAQQLNEPVRDRSVLGARINYALPITGALGLDITQQYRGGAWDWVVLNGGGNDLWLGCGCNVCTRKMTKMISDDGTSGKIPELVSKMRENGTQVLWVGYLRSPGVGSPIEGCRNEGDELEARIARLAKSETGVHFLSLADLVPEGDRSYHGLDMIHPSLKASKEIASRVSTYIRKVDKTR